MATRDVQQAQAFQYSKCRSASALLHQQQDYSPTVSHDPQRGNSQNNHNWTSQALQERLINQGMYNPTLSSSAQPPAAGLCRSDSFWENHATHQQVTDIDHLMYTSDNPVINYGQQEQELYYSDIPREDMLHLGSPSSSRSHGKGIRSKVRVNPSTPGRSLIELMPAPAAGKKLVMEEILADGLTLTLCSRADPATMPFT